MPRQRMEVKELDKVKSIFAESGISLPGRPVSSLESAGTLCNVRKQIRKNCPPGPGVYGMVNGEGHVNYVGMSQSLAKRLQSYFTRQKSRRKESAIRRSAGAVIWQRLDHQLIAKLRERELIRRFRPAWNVQGHPTQLKTGYIILTRQSAPAFQLVSVIPANHDGLWGPIPFHRRSVSAIEQLNQHSGLRDCPKSTVMQFAGRPIDEALAPACLRADLKTCLRPCLGGCSQAEYLNAVCDGRDFLSGKSRALLQDVEEQMRAAAHARQFELAAKLRDRLSQFQYLYDRLRKFHDWADAANFVYQCHSTIDETKLWIIVIRGVVQRVAFKPKSTSETQQICEVLDIANRISLGKGSESTEIKPGEFESARILYRWFRKYPNESACQITFKKALQTCQRLQRKAS